MDKPIIDLLREYAAGDVLPMHMPGHKRSGDSAERIPVSPYAVDLTEIPGFDDLNDPRGIIARSEALASKLWGSRSTFYSVNGSTSGVLSAVTAVCEAGRPVVVARNCHRSVYHALELSGAAPVFIAPVPTRGGLPGSVDPSAVEDALTACPDASAVVLTSPTYEGVISDIENICRAAHGRGVPVIVDEAHGAHLGLFGVFPEGAVGCGADVVIHSLHKTLCSLTQTAAVHVSGDLVDEDEIARRMAIFSTSSPSYVLTASIDAEVRALSESGGASLRRWRDALGVVEKTSERLLNLTVPRLSDDPAVFRADPSKIFVDSRAAGVTGDRLLALFRDEGVEVEAAYPHGVLAMTGEGDTEDTLLLFSRALEAVDPGLVPGDPAAPFAVLSVPPRVLSAVEAVRKPKVRVPLGEAAGRVSASYVFAYPPGVPLIVPGEAFTEETVEAIKRTGSGGARLHGVYPDGVDTVEK